MVVLLNFRAKIPPFAPKTAQHSRKLPVGHEGDGAYELPNGEILPVTNERNAENAPDHLETFLSYASWLKEEGKTASMEEHRKHYQRLIEVRQHMVALSDAWVKDNLVALEKFLLEARKAGTKLYRHVDTENIGTFGYSFGGAATLNLSLHSDLIKACVDLDGFFYSSNWQQPITQPVMLLQNDSSPALTFPFLNATHDAYLATVKDTQHGNFCDFGEIMAENQIATATVNGKEIELPILGKIDPATVEHITNMLLLDFFDKYLKDKNSQALDTDNVPKGVTVLKKIQDSEDNQ